MTFAFVTYTPYPDLAKAVDEATCDEFAKAGIAIMLVRHSYVQSKQISPTRKLADPRIEGDQWCAESLPHEWQLPTSSVERLRPDSPCNHGNDPNP